MQEYVNHILTGDSVIVTFTDSVKVIGRSNPLFSDLLNALRLGNTQNIAEKVDIASKITRHTNGRFYVVSGAIYLDGDLLPEVLSKRLLQFADQNVDCEPLIKFWQNLKQNPDPEVVEDLYAFLEKNNHPITKDGCFIAYKRVSNDFKDLRTGTFDNSPGKIVEMPRAEVDADRNRTCSTGQHLANWFYAFGFYGNGKMISAVVNPADVVAIPVDYNQAKMRTCRYRVLEEVAAPREELVYSGNYEEDWYKNPYEFDDEADLSD